MPIYDYVCSTCGHTLEVVHPVHGQGPSACPRCGGQMRKAYSPPAVHFKGTGWARKERSGGASRKRETAESGESATRPAESSSAPEKPVKPDKPKAPTAEAS